MAGTPRFFVEYTTRKGPRHVMLKGCRSIMEAHDRAKRLNVDVIEIKEWHNDRLPIDMINRRNRIRNVALLAAGILAAAIIALIVIF